MSIVIDVKLLKYFEKMLILFVDIYLISETVFVKLQSADCQLIIAIKAKCVKELISSLSSTVDKMKMWILTSIVTIVVLIVIVIVLITVTEINIAVSEMFFDF